MNARNTAVTDTLEFIRTIAAAPWREPGHKLPRPASESAWQQIVAVASAHLVLPALHLATANKPSGRNLDASNDAAADAAAFIARIHAANQARNCNLRASLLDAARALNDAGIIPMVLKGGAFLIDNDQALEPGEPAATNVASRMSDQPGAAPWRFMSDLDFLVREDRLQDAVKVITGLGYAAQHDSYDAAMDAHYPALVSPSGEVVVELHNRLFTARSAKPTPRELFQDAQLIDTAGAQLYRPSSAHRIAHLIAHAQLHNRFHGAKRIMMRDLLDLSMLLASSPEAIDWPAVMTNFPAPGEPHAARAFIALWLQWQQSLDDQTADITGAAEISNQDRKWAGQALARLHWPSWRRATYAAADRLALDLKRLASDPLSRRKAIAALTQPARARRNLARRCAKLRQMLWA